MMDELTKVQADEVLEQIAQYQAQIKAAEDERDEFIDHYAMKIASANDICERATEYARQEIAALTETLRRFAEANLPAGRKSIKLPSGTLKFRAVEPKYFINGREASSKSAELLTFAKDNAPQYVKTTEYVDWSGLKKYLQETGEVIDGMEIQQCPDTFKVETRG